MSYSNSTYQMLDQAVRLAKQARFEVLSVQLLSTSKRPKLCRLCRSTFHFI